MNPEKILQILMEIWCDQNGLKLESIRFEKKEGQDVKNQSNR